MAIKLYCKECGEELVVEIADRKDFGLTAAKLACEPCRYCQNQLKEKITEALNNG